LTSKHSYRHAAACQMKYLSRVRALSLNSTEENVKMSLSRLEKLTYFVVEQLCRKWSTAKPTNELLLMLEFCSYILSSNSCFYNLL
jgi:hypothetical protein